MTNPWAEQPGFDSWQGRIFIFITMSRVALASPSSYPVGTGLVCSRLKSNLGVKLITPLHVVLKLRLLSQIGGKKSSFRFT
jgi:hypothetical protein